MAKEDIKALLLEDYRHCADAMAKSEQSGETRLTFFIGLVTFCYGAIGTGIFKNDPAGPIANLRNIAIAATATLLAIGVVMLFRMITRNEKTDLAKRQLDEIRRTFEDHFDDTGVLSAYNIFPKHPKLIRRKFGSLADIVAVVNAILVAVFVVLLLNESTPSLVAQQSAGFFAAVFAAQFLFIRRQKYLHDSWLDSHFDKHTHAGGVVVDAKGQYLIIKSNGSASGDDEWVLPKGHIKQKTDIFEREKARAAALREVCEETGVVARIEGLAGSEYVGNDSDGKPQWAKFYLMTKIAEVAPEENRQVKWAPFEVAYDELKFPESKRLLRTAERFRTQTA